MNKQYLIHATPEDFTVSYSDGQWQANDGEQFEGDETGPTDAWGSLPGRLATALPCPGCTKRPIKGQYLWCRACLAKVTP